MNDPEVVSATRMVDPKKLKQIYYDIPKNVKLSLLVHLLLKDTTGLVMIFCNTKHSTDFVAKNDGDLVVVGDLFDFWFEYKHVVPKKHIDPLCIAITVVCIVAIEAGKLGIEGDQIVVGVMLGRAFQRSKIKFHILSSCPPLPQLTCPPLGCRAALTNTLSCNQIQE